MYQGKFSNKSGNRNHSREYELQQKRMEALEENRRQEGSAKAPSLVDSQNKQPIQKPQQPVQPPRQPVQKPQQPAQPLRQPVQKPQQPAQPLRQPVQKPQQPAQPTRQPIQKPRQPVKPPRQQIDSDVRLQNSPKLNQQAEKAAYDPNFSIDLNFESPALTFETEKREAPVPAEQAPVKVKRKKSKGAIVGGIVFYLVFILAIAAFLLGMQIRLRDLSAELSAFEKQQPEHVADVVFRDIFETPNWGAVYDNAKIQLSSFEGKDAYAAYMTDLAEGEKLTYRSALSEHSGKKQ